jgi:hypothetical protein
MNMATEPTAPTMKAAAQIMAMIMLKALMIGLFKRSWSTPDVAGFWAAVSRKILRMMKRIKPSNDARMRNMNFLAVRQGWTNARTKAVAERKARRIPSGLSSMPTTAATIASKAQIARRINVLFLLLGVEKAALMRASFFDSGSYRWLPDRMDEPHPSAGRVSVPSIG